MTDPTLIRRQNALRLFRAFAEHALACGAPPKGMEQAFAAALQISPSMWSQIKSARPIGDKLARQIERLRDMPAGWLDAALPPEPAPAATAGRRKRCGLLLLAHGARDAAWSAPFERVAQVARQQLGARCPVALAFLDFMTPRLPEAADALAAQGCRRIDIVPMFLGVGGHVRKDVPALLDAVRARHPQVELRLHPAIGEMPSVMEAMAAGVVRASRQP